MIVRQIIVGSMAVCCYIVACEKTKKAAVIDPGGDVDKVLAEAEQMGVTVDYVIATHGHPVVIGPSRKSFIGRLTGASVDDRLPGTLAALTPAAGISLSVVRVHDPAAARQFLEILTRLREAQT